MTFVRNHPLMFNPVYPLGRRPLVVRTNAPYRYTAVAVDQVAAADGSYQVLFLGTGESWEQPPGAINPTALSVKGRGQLAVRLPPSLAWLTQLMGPAPARLDQRAGGHVTGILGWTCTC